MEKKEENEDRVLKALGWLGMFATDSEYSDCKIYTDRKGSVYIKRKNCGAGERYSRNLTKKDLKKFREMLDEAAKVESVKPKKIGCGKTNVTTLYTKKFCAVEYVTERKNILSLEIRRNESLVEKINRRIQEGDEKGGAV